MLSSLRSLLLSGLHRLAEETLWLDELCARIVTLGTSKRPSALALITGFSLRRRVVEVDEGERGGIDDVEYEEEGGKRVVRDSERRARGR